MPPMLLTAAPALVLGLLVGSFLNVVVHRVPRGESVVHPPSHCPGCGAAIRARHNVPVWGWLVLRGRCFDCGTPVSVRYPLVEAATGLAFAATAVRLAGSPAVLPAYLVLVAGGIALALIDLDHHRLPDVIMLPAYPVLAVLLLLDASPSALLRAAAAAVLLLVVYAVIAIAASGGMGWGDVKLAGVLGGMLGYLSWGTFVVGAFLPFVLGAAVGVALVVGGRAGRRTALPFGPFMLLGAWIAVLGAGAWGDSYLRLVAG